MEKKNVRNAESTITLASVAIDGAIASFVKEAGSLSITEGAATIGAGTTARRVDRHVFVNLAYALTAKAASSKAGEHFKRIEQLYSSALPYQLETTPYPVDHSAQLAVVAQGADVLNDSTIGSTLVGKKPRLAQEESTPATEIQYDPSPKVARVHCKVVELERGRDKQKLEDAVLATLGYCVATFLYQEACSITQQAKGRAAQTEAGLCHLAGRLKQLVPFDRKCSSEVVIRKIPGWGNAIENLQVLQARQARQAANGGGDAPVKVGVHDHSAMHRFGRTRTNS
eukprot:SM000455S16460  [mRNA]  locus=s455:15896:21444:+ [translate_table: standard]